MYKTVDELLELIRVRLVAEPESFAKTGVLRRLAQFRTISRNFGHMKVSIPKPKMSEEGRELLKNSRPAPTRRPRQRRKPKKAGDTKPPSSVRATEESVATAAEKDEQEGD